MRGMLCPFIIANLEYDVSASIFVSRTSKCYVSMPYVNMNGRNQEHLNLDSEPGDKASNELYWVAFQGNFFS